MDCDLTKKIERYSFWKDRALNFSSFLKSQNFPPEKLAEIVKCGNYLEFNNYFTIDKIRLVNANFCRRHLLCGVCALRRSVKFLRVYVPKIQTIADGSDVYMLTLTVKNSENLLQAFNHLRLSVQKIFDNGRMFRAGKLKTWSEFSRFHSSVGSYEFKRGRSGGWHPHFHCLVFSDSACEPDTRRISQEWLNMTGDSKIIDCRAVYGRNLPITEDIDIGNSQGNCKKYDPLLSSAVEVLKYSLKINDLTFSDQFHAYNTLSGKNLIRSSGLFRGLQVEKSLLDSPFDDLDLPYIKMLFKFDKTSHRYNLSQSSLKDPSLSAALSAS